MKRPLRRVAALRSGRVSITAVLVLVIAPLLGCDPAGPVHPSGVRRLTILAESDTLRPGRSATLRAIATGLSGDVVDAPITWRSMTPTTLSVDSTGRVLAHAPGIGVVRASVGGVASERTLQLVNPPAVRLVFEPESLALVLPSAAVVALVQAFDAFDESVDGATITWSSEAPRIASVSGTGQVSAVAIGRTMLRASLDGVSRAIPVSVRAAGGPDAPRVDSVVPRNIVPGVSFTLYGARLVSATQQADVGVDGFPAQVLTATSTQVTAVLPPLTDACVPSTDAAVQVRTPAGYGATPARIQLAPRRQLAVGEAALLLTAASASCVELPAEGRYLATVLNTSRALGAGGIALALDVIGGQDVIATLQLGRTDAGATAQQAHFDLLERNRRALAVAQPVTVPVAPGLRTPSLLVPPTGGVVPVRVPDLDDPRLCAAFKSIGARTVYDGRRIAILEDTTTVIGGRPALAKKMDPAIAAIGAEVDATIWPLLERFGNPLVMDDRLDANGKVVIILTPALNAMRGGAIMGAVVTCDFFPRAAAPASNVGEMLYLQVPDVQLLSDADEALRVWRAAVRGTIAHELKHIVGFAERIARGQPLEESWLEEATARHAEELFTRAITGVSAGADAGYAPIRCENLASSGDPTCADTPQLMRPILSGLYRFLESPATRSPLGALAAGDDSYYGSAWSLLRWVMDHAAIDESHITRGLTISGQSGIANLEARSGWSWEEMLARWSLTLLTDGRGAFEAADATLRLRGWRLGELFEGFCVDGGGCGVGASVGGPFARAHPAQPLTLTTNVTVEIAEIVPGGFAAFDLTPGVVGSTRLLRLRGVGGAPLRQPVRLALLRIE